MMRLTMMMLIIAVDFKVNVYEYIDVTKYVDDQVEAEVVNISDGVGFAVDVNGLCRRWK